LRVLVDTAFLLNEYFYREPDKAKLRGGPAPTEGLVAAWAACHDALQALAGLPNVHLCLGEYAALRLASVLSDLHLPAGLVLEELRYWNANFRPLALSPGEAEYALEAGLSMHSTETRPAEDYLLAYLAKRYELDFVLSPMPRQVPILDTIRFRMPEDLVGELRAPNKAG
jgi:hypothetical protein